MRKYAKGQYTRYADDITISFPKDYPHRVRGTIQFVCKLARKFGYRVHIKQKLRIAAINSNASRDWW